ncbi:Uncharacterized protein TCM_021724 [Theobroma cacao]|uniref:Uncharacterized protein n=1 Tax=Theobroma cacao TaxID=3641 RepID=A0A061EYC9_THECC|nr:Uncharacterized protein TCM_021724 [Theobroma cacao]
MISSEITREQDEENTYFINSEVEKESIRWIIQYQKSLYWSSSSSSSLSSSAASSSSVSSCRSSSLLELMRSGSTSLKRLFEMEHTSLLTHFEDYSGSPMTKSIPLWGSDTDGEVQDPWESIKQTGPFHSFETGTPSGFASDGRFMEKDFSFRNRRTKNGNHRLTRKKSFRRLPGFGLWRCTGFRIRLRLRRLRTMICGKMF